MILSVSVADFVVPAVSLVGGAALAVGGGLVQEHFRYRRRRRVAARLLYDDVLGLIGSVAVDALIHPPDEEPREAWAIDEFDADMALWEEHRATLAEVRDPKKFEVVRDAYAQAHALRSYEPRAVVAWNAMLEAEQEAEIRRVLGEDESERNEEPAPDDREAEEADYEIESRAEAIPEAMDALEASARVLGTWAGYDLKVVEQAIIDAKPSPD